MPYSIVELLNNMRPEINQSIDLTLSRPSSGGGSYVDGSPDPALDPYFPERGYMTEEAAFFKFKRYRPTLAYIRGVGGEVPMDRETTELSMERIGSLLITKGRVFTEEDFKTRQKIEMLRSTGMTQAAQELMDMFTMVPAQLTTGWMATLRMLAQRVAVAGKALYTDNNTEIPVELDYTSQVPNGHFAATKTSNNRWSQLTTADGTKDLIDHLNAVYANVRQFPAAIALGSTEADNLRSQNSTRLKVARFMGRLTSETNPTDPSVLPRPTLDEIRQYISSELTSAAQNQGTAPQFIVSDAVYYRRLKSGVIESNLYLPAGYYQFMWTGYIECARFPTATNDFGTGLALVTEENKFPPRSEKIAIDGGGIPIVADPRYLAARNVENTALS